jgi:hypothetical protein
MGNLHCSEDCLPNKDRPDQSEETYDLDAEHQAAEYPRLRFGTYRTPSAWTIPGAGPAIYDSDLKDSARQEDGALSGGDLSSSTRDTSVASSSSESPLQLPQQALRTPSSENNDAEKKDSAQNYIAETPADTEAASVDTAGDACLEIVFDVKGEARTLMIYRRPFGAECAKRGSGPTKISKVHPSSYAAELGVEKGWVVKSVGGEDVRAWKFEKVQEAMTNGMAALPLQIASKGKGKGKGKGQGTCK